jgi:hypothetical protein
MFSGFKRAFGYVTATSKNGVIRIEGIPSYTIQNDIRKIWGTSRIEAFMFNDITKSSFSFNEFFALDIVYAIEKLLNERYVRTSRRVLHNVLKVLWEETWLVKIGKHHPPKLNRDKLKLFHKTPMDKQSEFFDIYESTTQQYHLRGMLLAAAAGSGKTITSIMLSEMLETDTTVVIAPLNSIIDVWEKTLRTELTYHPTFWHSQQNKPMKGDERYLVVHYEGLAAFLAQLHRLKGKKFNVVLDESHNFNTSTTLRTEHFVQMCTDLDTNDVLWMSGTPIKALGSEAIPLFRSIDKLFTPDTEFRFKKIFGLSSTRGADILNSRLGIVSYKVEKKDLPIQDPEILPPQKVKIPNGDEYTLDAITRKMAAFTAERLVYYKDLEKEHKAFYYGILDAHEAQLKSGAAKADYIAYRHNLKTVIHYGGDARFCADEVTAVNRYENTEIVPTLERDSAKQFKDIRSAVKYVMLKIRGECLGRVVAKERMRAHFDMVPFIDFQPILDSSEKKTVVFTSFVEVLERLQTILAKEGLETVSVYGKTNNVLSATLKRFEKDDDINPLLATYKSLSTAVPLLMADVVVLIDAPFRDYILQQTISRTSRLGATTRTTVHVFSLDTGDQPNISTRSFDILKWSQTQIEAIIGIKSPFEVSDDETENTLAMEEFEPTLNTEQQKLIPSFMDW